jgi:glutamate dehydrogenase
VRVRAFRHADDDKLTFRFKLYRPGAAAPLADVLPILEHMGLKALIEDGFKLTPADRRHGKVWVHEFTLRDERGEHLSFADIKTAFEAAFVAIWTGRAESDGFNRLVLELGVGWREAALVRALARYRQQTGLDPSQGVQEQALSDNPGVTRLILDLFRIKFDPAVRMPTWPRARSRPRRSRPASTRPCRRSRAWTPTASCAASPPWSAPIQRTNFFQVGPDGEPKPYISYKIASRELEDLPAPKPYREIFVFEGIHLRGGKVARGGLRWSDRPDDFRTEVLGLVKAQMVKNTVIVPVGSKGGFVLKKAPPASDREAFMKEGVACYQDYLRGLLDLTDNLVADKTVPPPQVVRIDGDDPYLVVAADKGTATFSDYANADQRRVRPLAGRRLRLGRQSATTTR